MLFATWANKNAVLFNFGALGLQSPALEYPWLCLYRSKFRQNIHKSFLPAWGIAGSWTTLSLSPLRAALNRLSVALSVWGEALPTRDAPSRGAAVRRCLSTWPLGPPPVYSGSGSPKPWVGACSSLSLSLSQNVLEQLWSTLRQTWEPFPTWARKWPFGYRHNLPAIILYPWEDGRWWEGSGFTRQGVTCHFFRTAAIGITLLHCLYSIALFLASCSEIAASAVLKAGCGQPSLLEAQRFTNYQELRITNSKISTYCDSCTCGPDLLLTQDWCVSCLQLSSKAGANFTFSLKNNGFGFLFDQILVHFPSFMAVSSSALSVGYQLCL